VFTGLGFRGSGFRVQGSGFRIQGSEDQRFRVHRFKVHGFSVQENKPLRVT